MKRNAPRVLEEDQARGGWKTSVISIVERMPLAMGAMDAAAGTSVDVVDGAIATGSPPQQGKEQ